VDGRHSEDAPPEGDSWPGEFPGGEEVPLLDWPTLFRRRVAHRIGASDRYASVALWTVLAGLFATGFSITILGVALKTIADDLHSTTSTLTWILTAPLLTLAIAMPLAGKLGDSYGHRRIYLIGFGIFTAVAIPTALAPNAAVLILLRVVGAFGGAATGPTSMAIVMHAFDKNDRVKAMGWWSLVGAGAPVIGLAVGGVVVSSIGWRWIFVGQAIVSAIALTIAFFVLRETPTRPAGRFDFAGAASLAVGTVALLLGIQRLRGVGLGDPLALALIAAGPIALALFVRIERRAAEPLLPLHFFEHRNFTASISAQFGANFAYMGSFIITPLLVKDRFGFSDSQSAAAMALRPLTFSLLAPIAGYVAVRTGERRTSIVGMVCVVAAMGAFAVAAFGDRLGFVYCGLALAGVGMGIANPSLVSVVGNAVQPSELGVANAAQSMIAQLGVVIGMGMMSTVQASSNGSGAFVAAYLLGGALAFAAVIAATFVHRVARPTETPAGALAA
jgi:EmrB/QacA subfamily drug resistance transporter